MYELSMSGPALKRSSVVQQQSRFYYTTYKLFVSLVALTNSLVLIAFSKHRTILGAYFHQCSTQDNITLPVPLCSLLLSSCINGNIFTL